MIDFFKFYHINNGDVMEKILITGGRSGIAGRVIENIKNKDYYIYVTVHTEKQLESVKKKYEDYKNIKCLKLDITDKNDREKLKNLDIDILFNNAAIGIGGSILELSIEKLKYNFEVNLFSYFEVVQIVIKNMIKKNKGKIILMSSLAGIMPIKFLGAYSATKASIIKLATVLKKELKLLNKNIDICLIEPGMYHTGFNQVMLNNKYDWMEKDTYFKNELELIRKKENIFFSIFEYYSLNTIVKKIIKAIESKNPNFIYRAPLNQVITAKLYSLFFE